MIFHPSRTGSCIMPPRRAVSCLLKLNPPARIGKNKHTVVLRPTIISDIEPREPVILGGRDGERESPSDTQIVTAQLSG